MQLVTTTALVSKGNMRVKQTRYGLMLYNIQDYYIGRSLDSYGEFSNEETKIFAQVIQPGMTVLDVGANIGVHTLYFSQAVGNGGEVLALEPQRILYQMLCANLALNDIANVRSFPVAAGRRSGEAFIPPIDYGQVGNFGGVALAAAKVGERVPVVTIDELALKQCHFIKIDVEGMEGEVLAGASETIDRYRPILYVENDRRDKSASLIHQLFEFNYALYWHLPPLFSAGNLFGNPENLFPTIVSLNMLCLPRERNLPVNGLKRIDDPSDWPLKKGSDGVSQKIGP
jgi:FkbM family methyltransferase